MHYATQYNTFQFVIGTSRWAIQYSTNEMLEVDTTICLSKENYNI